MCRIFRNVDLQRWLYRSPVFLRTALADCPQQKTYRKGFHLSTPIIVHAGSVYCLGNSCEFFASAQVRVEAGEVASGFLFRPIWQLRLSHDRWASTISCNKQ